jgi:hypothetical protein
MLSIKYALIPYYVMTALIVSILAQNEEKKSPAKKD